ncbi:MAG: hypothetical protein CM1200mP27_10450 [Chloroflexota bacterium]|nr:MAG: hypothetical protein CM1200mP27_10450 [Chloroflexota bacterium]
MASNLDSLQSSRVNIPDSQRAIQDYLWDQGWTEGPTFIAPTKPLVRKCFWLRGHPQDSLGRIHPGNPNVTLEKLAVKRPCRCLPSISRWFAAMKAALRDDSIWRQRRTPAGRPSL